MGSRRFYTNERHLRWNPDLVKDDSGQSRSGRSKSWSARQPPPASAAADQPNGSVNKDTPAYSVYLTSLHPTNNISGIILRNQQPIETVRPFGVYQTHKDTMRSLKSLEGKHISTNLHRKPDADQLFPEDDHQEVFSTPASTDSPDTTQRTISVRDANGSMKAKNIHPRRHMVELRFAVERLSGFVGKKRSGVFQTTIEQVCNVINSIFDERTDIKLPFKLHRLQYNGFYEIHGIRTIEMYMLPSNIDSTPLEVIYNRNNSLLADVIVHGQIPGLDHFCVKDKSKSTKRLSPCKLMVFLTHFIETTIKKRYDRRGRVKNGRPPTPHGAFIFNTGSNETNSSIRIKFPNDTYSYDITLTLAMNFDNSFPSTQMSSREREWPDNNVLNSVKEQGVHLLAKVGSNKDVHLWTVSFLKARRKLLQLTDTTGNKLRLLLALQALRETQLSRPRLLLPAHLSTVIFWASVKFPDENDWKDELIAHRFLDVVTALRRCMLRGVLWDFFVPTLNHFEEQPRSSLVELAFVH